MYVYVHADIQLFVINRLFLLLHLLIFDYFDYTLSVWNWTKYNTGISAWQAKSPFRPFDGFRKNNNQYPFIMQHELHWNRKIRLSQSINEAKHLLCVNARAKERASEWVSVSQPVQNLVDVNEYYFVGHKDWQVDRRSMSLLGETFHNKQRRMLLTQHVLY